MIIRNCISDFTNNSDFVKEKIQNIESFSDSPVAHLDGVLQDNNQQTCQANIPPSKNPPVNLSLEDAVLKVLYEKGQYLFSHPHDVRKLALALKSQGIGYAEFDRIVCQSPCYKPESNRNLWDLLHPTGITFGTAYYYAQQADPEYLQTLLSRVKTQRPPIPSWDVLQQRIEARSICEPPNSSEQNIERMILPEGKFISDLNIEIRPKELTLLHADTGTGKTANIITYSLRHPDEMVIALFPLVGVMQQAALKYDIHTVCEGEDFDYSAHCQFSTIDSFVRKFNPDYLPNLCPPITIFRDEIHCYVSDGSKNYKGRVFAEIDAACAIADKLIDMTATPYRLHDKMAYDRTIEVVQPHRSPDPVKFYLYEDPYKAIEKAILPGKVTVIEVNNKEVIKVLQNYLTVAGYSGIATLYKGDQTGLYEHIIQYESLPNDTNILITTRLFEMGLNIYGVNIGNMLIFPHKSHFKTRHQAESVTSPHDIKQYLNRFRDTTPENVFIMRPIYQDDNETVTFDGNESYAYWRQMADSQVAFYNRQIQTGTFRWHTYQKREDMGSTEASLTRYNKEREQFEVNDRGIDHQGWVEWLAAITDNITFYIEELEKVRLRYAGSMCEREQLSPTDQQNLEEATKQAVEEERSEFNEELEQLTEMSMKEIESMNHTPVSHQYLKLSQYFGRDDAATILQHTQGNGRTFSTIQKRVHTERYRHHPERIKAIEQIEMHFPVGESYDSKDFMKILKMILKQDRVLSLEFTDNSRFKSRCFTPTKAVRIMENLADIAVKHTKSGNTFTVKSYQPLHQQYEALTGKNLESNFWFRRYLNQKQHHPGMVQHSEHLESDHSILETPSNQANCGDTFTAESSIEFSDQSITADDAWWEPQHIVYR